MALHKPKCTIRKSVRHGIDETISYALITANGDSETFEEVMESPNRESWMQAMMEEMEIPQKESDMAASGSTRRCLTHWLQMDFHQKRDTFRARWSEVQGYTYSQRVLIKGRS